MAQYLPAWVNGDSLTLTTSADVVGGQLVSISGNSTVAPSAANDTSWIGVAAFDAKSGTPVTVFTEGVQRLAGTGITAGQLVKAAASGAVATGGTGDNVVGLCVGTDGSKYLVRLSR